MGWDISSNGNPQTPNRAIPPRLRWLDILRGIAVLGMIATHVAGALLATAWKQGELWNNLNISFGFVAPAFLLCSGITLWVAMQRRASPPTHAGNRTKKLLRRAGTIVLLGYWLQIPVLSIRQLIWRHDPTELARLFDSNILQVIGVVMAALIVCAQLVHSLSIARWVAAVVAVGVVAATPYVWEGNLYQALWLPFKAYVAPQPVASFSLFPHAAYFLVGFVVAPLLVRLGRWRFFFPLLAALGSASVALLLDACIGQFPPHDNYWHGSIQHTFFRLAGLFVLIALAQAVALWLPSGSQQDDKQHDGQEERRTLMEKIGARSLAIYVLHLMLIYGSPVNMGMTGWLNGRFSNAWGPALCLLGGIVITMLCYGAVVLWEWVGREYPQAKIWGKRLWWIVFWGLFLTIP